MAGRAACRRRRQAATRQDSEHQRRLPRGVKRRWQTGQGIVTRSLRNGVFSFRSGPFGTPYRCLGGATVSPPL